MKKRHKRVVKTTPVEQPEIVLADRIIADLNELNILVSDLERDYMGMRTDMQRQLMSARSIMLTFMLLYKLQGL